MTVQRVLQDESNNGEDLEKKVDDSGEELATSTGSDDSKTPMHLRSNTTTLRKVLKYTFATCAILAIWVGVLVRDLKQTQKTTVELPVIEQVTVDVREAQPLVTARMQLHVPQAKWSSLYLQGATCTLPSGRVDVQATPALPLQQDGDRADNANYVLEATCPVEDTSSHADYIWDWWKAMTTHTTIEQPFEVSCQVYVRVHFGNIVPFTHTHEISLKQQDDNDVENSNQVVDDSNTNARHKEAIDASSNIDESKDSTDPSWSKTVDSTTKTPFTHAHENSWKQQDDNEVENSNQVEDDSNTNAGDKEATDARSNTDLSKDSTDPSLSNTVDSTTKTSTKNQSKKKDQQWPSIVVDSWGPKVLQVHVPLEWQMPDALPLVNINVPAMTVEVHAKDVMTEKMRLALEETNVTLVSTPSTTTALGEDQNAFVMTVSCEKEEEQESTCPWYRPLAGTLFNREMSGAVDSSDSTTKVDITIDAQDSFLEAVLGDQHVWVIENYARSDLPPLPFGWQSDLIGAAQTTGRNRELVHDGDLPSISETKANCLKINEQDAQSLDVSMCLLLDASSSDEGEVITVANMTFYDSPMAGLGVFHWTQGGKIVEIDSRVIMDETSLGSGDNPRINATGDFRIQYLSKDTEIDWSFTNEGSWWPFKSVLSLKGAAEDSVLGLNLLDATLTADGEDYMKGGKGEVYLDFDSLIWRASVSDPKWTMEAVAEFVEDEIMPTRVDPYARPTPAPSPYPTTSPTTAWPTAQPTVEVTLPANSYAYFNGYGRMTLVGATFDTFDFEQPDAFQNTTMDFYRSIYSPSLVTDAGIIITEFDASVYYSFSDSDANGVIISFSFFVSFQSTGPSGKMFAERLLAAPFEDDALTSRYISKLKEAHSGFAFVTAASLEIVDDIYSDSNDDDWFGWGDSGQPVNGTKVSSFRGNSTGRKNGDNVWDASWLGEFWSFDYESSDSGVDFSTWREASNTFLELAFFEVVEGSELTVQFESISEYEYFYNFTDGTDLLRELDRFNLKDVVWRWASKHLLDMNFGMLIDYEAKNLVVHAQDNAKLDFVTDLGLSWYSESNGADVLESDSEDDVLYLEVLNMTSFGGDKLYADFKPSELGTVSDSGNRGSLTLLSKPGAYLELMTDFEYEWDDATEVFSLKLDEISVGWKGDSLTSASGVFSIDIDSETIGLELRDTSVKVFDADFLVSWYSESDDDWGLILNKAVLERGSDLDVNSTGAFRFRRLETNANIFDDIVGDPFGELEMKSTSLANMQMEMGLNFTWSEAEEYLQVVMDHCRMAYRDTVYIDQGIAAVASSDERPTPSSTDKPTLAPTQAPQVLTTSEPTPAPGVDSAESFEFKGITMRLTGVGQLSEESLSAFEDSTEDFYRAKYQSISTPSRRWLQATAGVTNFETTVTVQGQSPSNGGNTITYDQTISFVPVSGESVSTSDAQNMLATPLKDEQGRQDYVNKLKEKDPVFEAVTADEPTVPLPEKTSGNDDKDKDVPLDATSDDDGGFPVLIVVIIAVGVCCCGGAAAAGFYLTKRRGNPYVNDEEKGMPDEGNNFMFGGIGQCASDHFVDDAGPQETMPAGIFGHEQTHVLDAENPNNAFNTRSSGSDDDDDDDDEGSSSGDDDESSDGEDDESSSGDDSGDGKKDDSWF